jgi:hypothetical protein
MAKNLLENSQEAALFLVVFLGSAGVRIVALGLGLGPALGSRCGR